MIKSKIVCKHFSEGASSYRSNFLDHRSGKTHEFLARLGIVRGYVFGEGGSFLDCASGTGEVTASSLDVGKFDSAVVSDISERMLTYAKRLIGDGGSGCSVRYQVTDIFDFNKGHKEKFNVILCVGLIAHTGRLRELLLHLNGMLAPGGKIILQSSLIDHWGIRITKAISSRRYERLHGYTLSYYSIDEIKSTIRSVSLKIISEKRYCLAIPYLDKLLPGVNYWLEKLAINYSANHGAEAIFEISRESD
jgi:2-polyprenyl-3-methyl-5-hydroxy-6-metoxy-1,4-benzoquinol methylase